MRMVGSEAGKMIPQIIKGDIFIDHRGSVSYVNDFGLDAVKRFYVIQNHRTGFVRAWNGHKLESKYFSVIHGEMLLCGVKIDNWDEPSRDADVHRFVLSEKSPSVLFMPPGYANGFMSLTQGAKLLIYSNLSLVDSKADDYRFNPTYWNPWEDA